VFLFVPPANPFPNLFGGNGLSRVTTREVPDGFPSCFPLSGLFFFSQFFPSPVASECLPLLGSLVCFFSDSSTPASLTRFFKKPNSLDRTHPVDPSAPPSPDFPQKGSALSPSVPYRRSSSPRRRRVCKSSQRFRYPGFIHFRPPLLKNFFRFPAPSFPPPGTTKRPFSPFINRDQAPPCPSVRFGLQLVFFVRFFPPDEVSVRFSIWTHSCARILRSASFPQKTVV